MAGLIFLATPGNLCYVAYFLTVAPDLVRRTWQGIERTYNPGTICAGKICGSRLPCRRITGRPTGPAG